MSSPRPGSGNRKPGGGDGSAGRGGWQHQNTVTEIDDEKEQKPQLAADLLAEVKEAYTSFDFDMRGELQLRQIKLACRGLGVKVKKAEVVEMMVQQGIAPEGSAPFEAFAAMVLPLLMRRETDQELAKAFALFDEEGTGQINFHNLKRIVTELGEDVSDAELQEMLEEADKNRDGYINPAEFHHIMRKTTGDPFDDISSDEDG